MKSKANFINQTILMLLLIATSCSSPDTEKTHYELGIEYYSQEEYTKSMIEFKQVSDTLDQYDSAQVYIAECEKIIREEAEAQRIKDSLLLVEQQRIADSIKLAEKEAKINREIFDLKSKISSIDDFQSSRYRGSVSKLVNEIDLFKEYARFAERIENLDNTEVKKLHSRFVKKLEALQVSEFPKLRKAYAQIVKDKLWVENIEVEVSGGRYTTLQFTGGTFASNRNKQEFQTTLSDILYEFRFKRVNYKWYEYDDEYTYYTLNSMKDSELSKY